MVLEKGSGPAEHVTEQKIDRPCLLQSIQVSSLPFIGALFQSKLSTAFSVQVVRQENFKWESSEGERGKII